jgi:hypothetical protein
VRVLGILACTIIGGTILYSAVAAIALFALDALGIPTGINGLILLLLFPASYVFAAWAGSRLIKKKQTAPAAKAAAKTTFRRAPIGIAIGAILIIIAGIHYLEYRAESSAKAFCDAALVGTPTEDVAAAARGKGTDMLRRIKPDSVTVGFTGLPPYSRHFCETEAVDGKVTKAKYLYLD